MDPDLQRQLDEVLGGKRATAAPPGSRSDRARQVLRSRLFPAALVLALVEVIALVVWKGSTLLGVVAAGLMLAIAIWIWLQLKPGITRDIAGLVAVAQAFVVAVPLVFALSTLLAVFVAVAIIGGLIAMVFRSSR
jgi:hypothetical protein